MDAKFDDNDKDDGNSIDKSTYLLYLTKLVHHHFSLEVICAQAKVFLDTISELTRCGTRIQDRLIHFIKIPVGIFFTKKDLRSSLQMQTDRHISSILTYIIRNTHVYAVYLLAFSAIEISA